MLVELLSDWKGPVLGNGLLMCLKEIQKSHKTLYAQFS